MTNKPRILFLGYSEVGYECLSLLLERGDNVVALITHEDNPNEKIWFKTPAAAACEHKPAVPVYTPDSVNTPEWIVRIRDEIRPDLILSVYYRNMVSTKVLEISRLGAFNMHGSLLPKYRGRAPINWAVLHGESRIGMTLHKMVKRADAGDIVDQAGVDIGPLDTAEQAFRKVLPCARTVLARQIDALLAGTASVTPQDESQATYFGGRKPEDGRVQWTNTSAQIFNLIRAVTDPYPGAFVDVAGARLMVWWAEAPGNSEAAYEALQQDARNRRYVTPIAATASPIPQRPAPGEILSLTPLIVATGDGALELTRTEWRGSPTAPLQIGQIL